MVLVARLTGSFGLRFVHAESAAAETRPVKGFHSAGSIGVFHFNETETARTAGFSIAHQFHGIDGTMARKQIADFIFRRRPGQVAHIKRLGHVQKSSQKRKKIPRRKNPAYICRNCAFPYKFTCPKRKPTSIEKSPFLQFFSTLYKISKKTKRHKNIMSFFLYQ
jgi:hypothetical protein